MKKLLLLSSLIIFNCSNSPDKNIFVWNYYTSYDELNEETTFKSKVYSSTQTNFDFPYSDASYFLEIKTIIPDNIKTFKDFLDYSKRQQTNLMNIKCDGCPLFDYGKKNLKYKIDDNSPKYYIGYNAEKDEDELGKYAFLPQTGTDWFVKNELGKQNHTKLLIAFPTVGKGQKQISFNISNFNILDVIKRNHFKEIENTQEKTSTENLKNEKLDSVDNDFYIIAEDIASTEEEAKRKVDILKYEGFEKVGYLWIPDYKSLSGAEYFSVYIGPFPTIDECAITVEEYRKSNPSAYGLLVSNKSSKRVEIRGPNRITTK